MDASYLRHHMERSHGRLLMQVRGVDVGRGGLEVYKVSLPRILMLVECPVEVFPAKEKPLGKAKGTLYVSSLEIEGGHLSGGSGTVTAVGSVRYVHAGGQTL